MNENLKTKQLAHISLFTNDLKKVEKFYCNILGMKIAHKFINSKNEIYGFFLSSGNSTFLEFFKSQNFSVKDEKLRHFCFEVENIYEIRKIFEKENINISITRGKTDKILQFMVKDFEDNLIEFQQHDEQSKLKPYIDETVRSNT